MRVLKDPDVRRAEILDTAQQLFVTKGYAKTTIVDILNAIGIAKGTFYYYFKSKEEVMDAVITRVIEQDAARAKKIAVNPSLPAAEKLFQILMRQQPRQGDAKDKMLRQFHQPSNAEMHQRSLVMGIRSLSPILADVVREGVEQGAFATSHPDEAVEFLLAAGQVVFDEGLFQWTPEERAVKAQAFVSIMETTLGARPGSLAAMLEILKRA